MDHHKHHDDHHKKHWAIFNAVVAALYCLLAIAVAARMILKCVKRGSSSVKRNLVATGVNILVILYCVVRTVSLIAIATGETPNRGHIRGHLWTSIPATFFVLLQTGLIAKWVHHVNSLMVVVLNERFKMGYVALTLSGIIGACMAAVNVAAFIRLEVAPLSSSESRSWNIALCFVCGFAYAFNGVCFITLGIRLRRLWSPTSEAGKSMARKILLVAAIFGLLCVVRGVALTLYAFRSMGHVDHAGWAAPATLVVEWTALSITIFLLSSASSEAEQQGESTSIQRVQAEQPLFSRSTLRSSMSRRMDYSTAADQPIV